MRKKITQLAKGVMGAKLPRIRIVTSPVDETVLCGQIFRGEITLISDNGVPFRGLAYPDDERIEIAQNSFAGANATVEYRVRADQIQDSVELVGQFALVTNAGEVYLPYHFSVCRPILLQDDAPTTVKELGELAAAAPEKVFRLFQSEQFLQLPFFKDDSLRALYPALKNSPDPRLGLEEFLVAAGAKEAVVLKVDAEPQHYALRAPSDGGELVIRREGSGYTVFTVRAENSFIRLPKERWTGLDFSGDELRIPLYFDPEKLHAGKNFGSLTVNTGRDEVTVSLTVVPEREPDPEQRKLKQYRRNDLQLAKSMLTLYAAKEKPRGIEVQVMKYLDACDSLKAPDIPRKILRAEILRQLGRRDAEKEVLEQIRATVQRNRTEDVTSYLWFLYLEEEREKGNRLSDGFLRLLYRLKEKEWDKPEILPLLIRADSEWAEQPEKSLNKIREHFARGPLPLLLRIEAIDLLDRYPELLTEVSSFERSILIPGVRYGCFHEELLRKVTELVPRQKFYHEGNERLLRYLYQAQPSEETLTALLGVVMRFGEALPRCHSLYEKGIEEDVRLTELYEYYLATLPADYGGEIPRMVELYYTYNSPQLAQARLNLYHYLLRHYQPEDPLYRLYERQLRSFALEQLLQGSVEDGMAEFYERMFIPDVLDEKTAAILSELIYTVELEFSNSRIERVMLLYGELKDDYLYPVRRGKAYVPVYTRNCRLVFIDREGNRYAQTVFRRKRFMKTAQSLHDPCRKLCPESLPFRLELCRGGMNGTLSEAEARELIRRYPLWEELSDIYREKLILSLVKRRDLSGVESAALLKALKDSPFLDAKAGRLLAENFMLREEDEAAVEMVFRFGYRNFSPELLLRLLGRQIRKRSYAYERDLFGVTLSLYRQGSWNEITLTYLCKYYNNGTAEMLTLLDRTLESGTLYLDLPERLLGQMLFTGWTKRLDEVVRLYLKESKAPDRTLLHAYAMVMSEQYFTAGEAVPENLFTYLKNWAEADKKTEALPLIGRLALTKHYAEKESLTEEEKQLASSLLQQLYDQGLLFSFEKKLARFIRVPAEIADKVFLEYRDPARRKIRIGLQILPQEAEEDYTWSEIPDVYRGICVKTVLLFADEVLEYRIETVQDGAPLLLEEGRVEGRGETHEGNHRFARLNRLIAQAGDGTDPSWQEAVTEFGREDVLLKEYFSVN